MYENRREMYRRLNIGASSRAGGEEWRSMQPGTQGRKAREEPVPTDTDRQSCMDYLTYLCLRLVRLVLNISTVSYTRLDSIWDMGRTSETF